MTKARRPSLHAAREAGLNVLGVAAVGVLIFPVYWALCAALGNDPNFYISSPALIPVHLAWDNFRSALQQEGGNIATSLIVASSVVVIGVLFAVPTAYGLKRFRVRYGASVVVAMLMTQMVPAIALSISFYSLFRHFPSSEQLLGPDTGRFDLCRPLMVVLIRAYMVSVPDELFEAARVDGCGEFRCLRSVIVPVAIPGIVTAALFGFLAGWGDFVFALTLNGGGSVEPVTLGLYKFVGNYSISWGPVMATVILAAVPAAIVLAVAQRWVRGGLRAGSLKG